jgi:hypothetical protein
MTLLANYGCMKVNKEVIEKKELVLKVWIRKGNATIRMAKQNHRRYKKEGKIYRRQW